MTRHLTDFRRTLSSFPLSYQAQYWRHNTTIRQGRITLPHLQGHTFQCIQSTASLLCCKAALMTHITCSGELLLSYQFPIHTDNRHIKNLYKFFFRSHRPNLTLYTSGQQVTHFPFKVLLHSINLTVEHV